MKLSPSAIRQRVIIATLIGVAVLIWLFHKDFSSASFSSIKWNGHVLAGLVAAVLAVIGRDLGLAWRFRIITDKAISWKQAFRVDLMCAFTSAITPSAMGGSALAVFYLNREGISVGRATTLTLTTLLLDELFFVVFCPIIFMALPAKALFGSVSIGNSAIETFLGSIELIFWTVYAGIVIYTLLLFCGILLKPHTVAAAIKRLFSFRWLSRWQKGAFETADNMVATSAEVRRKNLRWWAQVFSATTLSWFSRYLVVNAIFWAFVPAASGAVVFGRQFVVWVVLMVSPTPGGSGVSEWLFTNYYGDLIDSLSLALMLALLWRILSYYIYLGAGTVLVPSYFRASSKKTEKQALTSK